ncbi:MAG TPA: nitrate- and nitrite sensing domain-containing protein, partial [Pseudonocardiaceae bacterium]
MTGPDVARKPAPAHSAHRRRGIRSWWESTAEWRNWRLPVKVAAVLVVPAVAAIALGAIQIRSDVARANSLADVQKLIQLRDALIPLTTDLQTERWLSAQKLGTNAPLSVATLRQAATKVDRDVATVTGLGERLLDPVSPAGIRYQGLVGQFGGLPTLQQQALANSADVVTVISSYSQVINATLDLEQALVPQFADPQLTGLALSLNDIDVAQEQVRLQEAIVGVALTRGSLLDTELQTMQSSDVLLQDRLNNFQIGITSDQLAQFQQQDITNDLNNREQIAQQVISNGLTLMVVGGTGQGILSLGVAPSAWDSVSDASGNQLARIAGQFAHDLTSTSASLQDQASSSAGIESVILFAVLLLAVGVGVIIGRHLLRSLGILRRTALDVAEYRLPEVVAAIDRGATDDLAIEPVPVHTHEELGQLARAFDAVHGQAVRSAVGQAALRSNLRSVFVNLSRRSQSLVERQLRLMERLERNEEDPQQLANLFKLDHLATRMRRNNENLMVLSGDDPARRSSGPLPLADIVRAAVSEIEHYQRVVVRSTLGGSAVLGYAAGDLTRLVAELLDNATSFSPPQAQVLVGGRSFPDGSVRIEIRDEGIGMAAADLIEANAKLDAGDTPDVPVSRQMGLYVVGRLARRHSIRVVLETPKDGGLLAIVQVPAELVKPGLAPRQSPALSIETPFTGRRNGHTPNGDGH